MRQFALLTAAMLAALLISAIVLQKPPSYTPGVDDGPVEMFTTIAEAEKATGFDFPDAGAPPGWKVENVSVTPAWYPQRLIAEHPEIRYRPLPNQDGQRYRAPITWNVLPDPPPGVHNYVNVTYSSERYVLVSLAMNYRLGRYPLLPDTAVSNLVRESIRLNGQNTTLLKYTSGDIDIMSTVWRVRGVPILATALNAGVPSTYRFSSDEFVDFLSNVH